MTFNPNPAMTAEAFEAFLKASPHRHQSWELVGGQPTERANTREQGMIVSHIIYRLYNYTRKSRQGRVATSIWHYQADDPYNVRMPNIAYYARDSRPVVKEGFVPSYPDLAVEVKSHIEDDTLITDRGMFYLTRGTKIVWLVYPDQKIIDVMTSSSIQTLTRADMLTGDDVLPNFSIPVAEIFQLHPSES